jgi:hypothetical protein
MYICIRKMVKLSVIIIEALSGMNYIHSCIQYSSVEVNCLCRINCLEFGYGFRRNQHKEGKSGNGKNRSVLLLRMFNATYFGLSSKSHHQAKLEY